MPKLPKTKQYVLRYASGLYLASPIGAPGAYTHSKTKATKLSLSSARYYASFHDDGGKNPLVEPMVSDKWDCYLHLVEMAKTKYKHDDGSIPMGSLAVPSSFARVEKFLFRRLLAS